MSTDAKEGPRGRGQIPRAWRWVLVLAGVVAFIAIFYAEENWRGRRAWEKYERELAARGVPTKLSELVPPSVPDDQNFAMTPFLAPLFDFLPDTQHWRDTNAVATIQNFPPEFSAAASRVKPAKSPRSNSWVAASLDLSAWDAALRQGSGQDRDPQVRPVRLNLSAAEAAAGVLASLAKFEPVIEELRVASRRPYVRFNLAYDAPNPAAVLLPHLALLKRTSQLLHVRACAELVAGRADEAFADLELIFYLAESIRNEPILISHLVRIAESQIALQVVAQGLANRQWSDAQLGAIGKRLGQFDFCADRLRAFDGERVLFGGGVIDYIRTAPNRFEAIQLLGGPSAQQGSGFDPVAAIFGLAPSGWLYLEKVNYSRAFVDYLRPVLDASGRQVNPRTAEQAATQIEATLKQRGLGSIFRHQFFIGLLLPALSKTEQRTAYAQTALDLASLACALERYRLAHGAYPDSLEGVAPQFIARLPHDVITGQALIYRRTDTGHYVLYSVGWNEKDDGGTVALNKSGESVDLEAGDWVWAPLTAPQTGQ